MSRSAADARYYERHKARIYQRQKDRLARQRIEQERTEAAQWLIREVLSYVEPPQRINYFPPMPVRRPLLTLRRR